MTPGLELEKLQPPGQSVSNGEIDLREVGCTLGRHRRLIAGITGAMVLLSGLHALTKKQIWEGQFQIVLEEKVSNQGSLSRAINANPMLAQFAGLAGGGGSSLETEVKILESPSVLMPVYQFVRQQKQQKGFLRVPKSAQKFSRPCRNLSNCPQGLPKGFPRPGQNHTQIRFKLKIQFYAILGAPKATESLPNTTQRPSRMKPKSIKNPCGKKHVFSKQVFIDFSQFSTSKSVHAVFNEVPKMQNRKNHIFAA